MKKFSILFFIIITIVFSACKKENNFAPKPSITGKWYWVEQTYDSYINNQLTNHAIYTSELDPQSYFEFDSDGTFIENPQNRNGKFKYGTYQLKGDSLIFTQENNNDRWAIKNLSVSSLIIHRTTGDAPYRGEVTYSMKR